MNGLKHGSSALAFFSLLALATTVCAQDAGGDSSPPPPRFVTGQADGAPHPAADAETSARTRRQAHVEIDAATRTLIITTDPATNRQISEVIAALDKPVPQALIKVLFLEVTHSDDLDLGVDMTHDRTDKHGNRSILTSLFGLATETEGGIVSVLQNDLRVTLRAIAEVGKLNVLSRPSILARNGQEATITVGQMVPFIRNSRVTESGQTINTVEYEDIGIILSVTPQIGADGLIEMQISPEISTLTTSTVPISPGVNAPIIAKRSAVTNVVVPNGRTVVIGGLMEDQEDTRVRKVPLLGDIPGIGMLFRRQIVGKRKTELLIFLTPIMVDSSEGLVEVSGQERRHTEIIDREVAPELLQRYLYP